MKSFVLAAAAALAIGVAAPSRADAQLVYGYSVPTYNGGIASGKRIIAPGAYQSYNSYYSPLTGVVQKQVYYSDMFGQVYGRSFGYNPWTGLGYNSGFYRPNYYVPPVGFGVFRRW